MNPLYSKPFDGLRAGKRKRSRKPSPPTKNGSLPDYSEHGDNYTNKVARAPASEGQGHKPRSNEQAVADTSNNGWHTPGRVPERAQTANDRDITELKQAFDRHIQHSGTTARNTYLGPYSPDPASDFEVRREPSVAASTAVDRSEGPKDPIS